MLQTEYDLKGQDMILHWEIAHKAHFISWQVWTRNLMEPLPKRCFFCTGIIYFLCKSYKVQHWQPSESFVQTYIPKWTVFFLPHFLLKTFQPLLHDHAQQCHISVTDQSKSRRGNWSWLSLTTQLFYNFILQGQSVFEINVILKQYLKQHDFFRTFS